MVKNADGNSGDLDRSSVCLNVDHPNPELKCTADLENTVELLATIKEDANRRGLFSAELVFEKAINRIKEIINCNNGNIFDVK
jgi:hypothetical protein